MGTDTGTDLAPAVSKSHTPRLNLSKWISRLSSSIILAGAAAYFLGFVVVNSYLYGYGISPFDFVQPRYISAGLLYLFLTVFLSAFLWFSYHFIKNHIYRDQPWNAERRTAATIEILFVISGSLLSISRKDQTDKISFSIGLALLWLVLALQSIDWLPAKYPLFARATNWWSREIIESGILKWLVFGCMLLYISTVTGLKASAFYYCFFIAILFAKSVVILNPNQTNIDKATTIGIVPILSLGLIWASLYTFGTFTYPLLPSAIGGGKPSLVAIALKPDSTKPDYRKTIGAIMGREDWRCVMQNIEVIHENNDVLYVLPHGYYSEESAIAIPKNHITVLAYQKAILGEQSRCYE